MGYYDNYDRRGGGGYGGRDNGGYGRGGYGRGGYDRQPFDRMDGRGRFRFDIGQKVVHSATGIELSVISFGREQIECRMQDLSTAWFYEHELEPVDMNKK